MNKQGKKCKTEQRQLKLVACWRKSYQLESFKKFTLKICMLVCIVQLKRHSFYPFVCFDFYWAVFIPSLSHKRWNKLPPQLALLTPFFFCVHNQQQQLFFLSFFLKKFFIHVQCRHQVVTWSYRRLWLFSWRRGETLTVFCHFSGSLREILFDL